MAGGIELRRSDGSDAEARALDAEAADELRSRYPGDPVPGLPRDLLVSGAGVLLVARRGGRAVGCGGLFPLSEELAEIRRMYVRHGARRSGVGRRLLAELEAEARRRGYAALRLETGRRQPEAVALYREAGFVRTRPFGPHAEDPESLFFEKRIAGPAPRLKTPRLVLEPLGPEHADVLWAAYADPEVARHLLSPALDRREFEASFAAMLRMAGTLGMWALREKASGALAGRVGFYFFGPSRTPELAFLLTRGFWGRGLATQACRAALRHGFADGEFREVVALVRPGNAPAIRVVEKLGMRRARQRAINGRLALVYRTVDPRGR